MYYRHRLGLEKNLGKFLKERENHLLIGQFLENNAEFIDELGWAKSAGSLEDTVQAARRQMVAA